MHLRFCPIEYLFNCVNDPPMSDQTIVSLCFIFLPIPALFSFRSSRKSGRLSTDSSTATAMPTLTVEILKEKKKRRENEQELRQEFTVAIQN